MSSQQWKNDNTVRYNLLILKNQEFLMHLRKQARRLKKANNYLIAESQTSW